MQIISNYFYDEIPYYSPYYAVGEWTNPNKKPSCHFENSMFIGNGISKDVPQTFFRVNNQFISSSENTFSTFQNRFIQAQTPENLVERLSKITKNSGKFLVFVEPNFIEKVWIELKKDYEKGSLGYGLQSSTEFFKTQNSCLITAHCEDSFNLDAIGKIAYRINETMQRVFKDKWSTNLPYITDFNIKLRFGNDNYGQEYQEALVKNLYIIKTGFFSNRKGKKPEWLFVKDFKQNNMNSADSAEKLMENESLQDLLKYSVPFNENEIANNPELRFI